MSDALSKVWSEIPQEVKNGWKKALIQVLDSSSGHFSDRFFYFGEASSYMILDDLARLFGIGLPGEVVAKILNEMIASGDLVLEFGPHPKTDDIGINIRVMNNESSSC